jgi:hypothetical protein
MAIPVQTAIAFVTWSRKNPLFGYRLKHGKNTLNITVNICVGSEQERSVKGNRSSYSDSYIRLYLINNMKVDESGCWLWQKVIGSNGYGYCTYKGKWGTVHRIAYQVFVGEIPEGKDICHHCDVKKCFNPTHLFPGTAVENAQDMIRKGRNWRVIGENNCKAKLTENKVRRIRKEHVPHVVTHAMLAEKYGISQSVIQGILTNKTWKHVH